jgi:hypothetical protein
MDSSVAIAFGAVGILSCNVRVVPCVPATQDDAFRISKD